MTKKNNKEDFEPPWLDPANDRKTPYTEEELGLFARGFIDSNKEAWIELVNEHGEEQAWNIVKDGFRKMDERNILNIDADNSNIH